MIVLALLFAAAAVEQLRWLRVAQREHYLARSVLRFALRWWRSTPANITVVLLAAAAVGASFRLSYASLGVGVMVVVAPFRLSLRGRTSKLAWTRRLRLLAAVALALWTLPVVLVALFARPEAVRTAALLLIAEPILVDLALAFTAPLERRLGERFVDRARVRLDRCSPTVVAITGSYGKTTTKGYVAHLLKGHHEVLASPRSFNNQAGLARTVNDYLTPGIEVLVAEMGTYGPGEIARMCSWLRPSVAVMTAIGPVHLERFRSLDRTLASKAEITATAETVVLNVDDELLSALVAPLRASGKRVITCSEQNTAADVCLVAHDGKISLYEAGRCSATVEVSAELRPAALTNVACAIGVGIAIGEPSAEMVREIGGLPRAENRLARATGASGVAILDDTFNSNPAGAALALALLEETAIGAGRAVLITPGMIELGPLQRVENRELARRASQFCSDVVVVGRTNRRALCEGIAQRVNLVLAADRDEAVAWVRNNLGADDVVLYENDLPDHYP